MVLSMQRWVGKVAIVTGASGGIGAAIARNLVENGVQVVGLARRKEKIDELSQQLEGQKGKLYALKADVGKEEDILNAFKWTTENVGPVHILVNNAAVQFLESFIDGVTDHWKTALDVNVLHYCIATREAVRIMRDNNIDGHIVYINSSSGHRVPNLAYGNIYPATKFAITALTETLRLELNSINSKIKISSVSPGMVATPLQTAEKQKLQKTESARMLNSEDIADAVAYVLSTPPHVQVHEMIVRPL